MSHQMAPWIPMFIQSCKNNTEPFVSFQFATVDELTNKPRCRTVVFRDFLFHDKRTNVLTFNTDMRSSKITESFITPNSNNSSDSKRCETPFFEACFYFPETWEQYRFSGQCFTISKQFKKIPAEIVTKKPAPGQKLTSETSKQLDKLHRGVDGAKEDAGLENFGIVCLCVDSVDFLNLKEGSGGERWIFQKTDGKDEDLWEEQEVCP
ncbi:AVN_HP_G0102510.mRNA.1.CDS.1 [Saccharomyces cerevisiae]|nr:BEM_HP_G0148190.mRNA.1.CDS.1 [Saccharomyces cerevisiae]CAI5007689.1 AVN_HP_G0049990.mRNA.1.CDS.1 [Saccharomyces cerevisiae]CAI5117601.1 AVN_HP_G0102510.mRNA.1.CDS.1 [Saccharomyces cerevisiae]CAI5146143.1 ANL_HP_G0120640.mRNA.1.CDS.1 [Saccharomyces cerevisiae]CAI5194620.1 BEM_HP_G0094940.mRNA.1.CDS.1 [Saccharomyces cerevisiae]